MRIRQVRPEFWQDEEISAWSEGLRLFYIGLWCVSDDAGYFDYEISRISALLYPYESRKRRETRVAAWLVVLEEAGKVARFDPNCSHAVIPALKRHQKTGGQPSYVVQKAHDGETRSTTDFPVSNVRVGNVRVRGGTGGTAGAPKGAARGGLPFTFEEATRKAPA